MAIDIGDTASDRNWYGQELYTEISGVNPANASGTITNVEIWAKTDLSNCVVGTFYTTNGNTLKCRDSEAIGSVTSGSKQTFSGLSITVEIGDYIGIYYSAGAIERSTFGAEGYWYVEGEYIDPDDEVTYSLQATQGISLYGTGTEAGGVTHYGTATLSGMGSLIASAVSTLVGKATLAGTGMLSAKGVGIFIGKATLAGVGTLSAIGQVITAFILGKVTFSGIGSLTAKAIVAYVRIISLKLGIRRPFNISVGTRKAFNIKLNVRRAFDITLETKGG